MNIKILENFQICIGVPLITMTNISKTTVLYNYDVIFIDNKFRWIWSFTAFMICINFILINIRFSNSVKSE